MIAVPIILLVLSVAVLVVAVLAWSAKLPGNSYIGIRVEQARKSREYWDITHRPAGPVWTAAALALAGAAALGFAAVHSPWLWLWVAVMVFLALALLGIGAALGARMIAMYDAAVRSAEEASGGCCGGGGSCGGHEEPAPAQVDFTALRRATNNAQPKG